MLAIRRDQPSISGAGKRSLRVGHIKSGILARHCLGNGGGMISSATMRYRNSLADHFQAKVFQNEFEILVGLGRFALIVQHGFKP